MFYSGESEVVRWGVERQARGKEVGLTCKASQSDPCCACKPCIADQMLTQHIERLRRDAGVPALESHAICLSPTAPTQRLMRSKLTPRGPSSSSTASTWVGLRTQAHRQIWQLAILRLLRRLLLCCLLLASGARVVPGAFVVGAHIEVTVHRIVDAQLHRHAFSHLAEGARPYSMPGLGC